MLFNTKWALMIIYHFANSPKLKTATLCWKYVIPVVFAINLTSVSISYYLKCIHIMYDIGNLVTSKNFTKSPENVWHPHVSMPVKTFGGNFLKVCQAGFKQDARLSTKCDWADMDPQVMYQNSSPSLFWSKNTIK